MARLPRLKVENQVGWYHLCARVAGALHWSPFRDPVARQKLLETLRQYLAVYFCEAAGFCLMDNHYHLVVRFQPFRRLSREQLYERARRLYPDPDQILRSQPQWQRFNHRLFDLSEFMRNVQQSYTQWYNQHYHRRGSLWAERFHSVLLGQEQSILDTLLYVDLNPVRAGLVEHPEDWAWSSAALRSSQQDHWLIPLQQLLPACPPSSAVAAYRALLYHRGAVPTQPHTTTIPRTLQQHEKTRGFPTPGAFRQRLPFFSYGLFLGSPLQIHHWLTQLRRHGHYKRRRYPIPQRVDQATFYTLREQRTLPLLA